MEMKQIKNWMVIVMCISALFSLFGCEEFKKRHILDGPGMVNVAKWESFSISQSHNCADYNFEFTVTHNEFEDYYVMGTCRDDEGNIYEEYENGIAITYETVSQLRALELDELADVKKDQEAQEDDLFVLDGTTVTLVLTYLDGKVVEKAVSNDLAYQIYNYLSSYFISK